MTRIKRDLTMEISELSEKMKNFFMGKLFFYIVFCSVFITLFLIINMNAVNVPYWDQFTMVDFLNKFHEERLTIYDFWNQFNEHRIMVPLMIEFVIAYFSNLNVTYEIYVSLFLIFLIAVLFFIVFTEDFKNIRSYYLYFIPILFLLVTFRQYTNYLWGFDLCAYMSILFVILSIYILIRYDHTNGIYLAMFTAIIASLSFFTGLLIFPIGFIIIFIVNKKPRISVYWAIFSISFLVLFFWNWTTHKYSSGLFNFKSPSSLIEYFLTILGSPLADGVTSAGVIGLLLGLITLWTFFLIYKTNIQHHYYFWIFVLGYSFSCGIMNAVGRANWGIANAYMSRYTPFTLVGIISLYCLIFGLLNFSIQEQKNERKYPFLFGSFIMLLTIGLLLGNIQGYHEFASRNVLGLPNDNLLTNQYYLATYQNQSDKNLTYIFPDPQSLRKNFIPTMEKYRLNIFHDNATIEKITKNPL